MDKDRKKFIKTNISKNIQTAKSLLAFSIGDEVIIYGIGRCIVPTPDKNALLIMEDDRDITDDTGNMYVLIRHEHNIYRCIEDGNLTVLDGKSLFVRGIIVDRKKYSRVIDGIVEKAEVSLIEPTCEIRMLPDDISETKEDIS